MDPSPGGHAVQDQNRGDNRLQIAVQLSLRVKDGDRVRTHRVTGKIQKTVERWYGDK